MVTITNVTYRGFTLVQWERIKDAPVCYRTTSCKCDAGCKYAIQIEEDPVTFLADARCISTDIFGTVEMDNTTFVRMFLGEVDTILSLVPEERDFSICLSPAFHDLLLTPENRESARDQMEVAWREKAAEVGIPLC